MPKFATILVLYLIGASTMAFGQEKASVAGPFGIKLNQASSCSFFRSMYQTKLAKNQFPDGPRIYETINPTELYPNARSIVLLCDGERTVHISMTANKIKPLQADVKLALDGLKEKYKYRKGDLEVGRELTSSNFGAGNVEIKLRSDAQYDYFIIEYIVHPNTLPEPEEERREQIRQGVDDPKKQKSAL